MGTPELYICTSCVKITPCTNKEAKALITKTNRIYFTIDTEEELQGYLLEYPAAKFWSTEITEKYTKFSEVKNNPIAIKAYNYAKKNNDKSHSSTGVSK